MSTIVYEYDRLLRRQKPQLFLVSKLSEMCTLKRAWNSEKIMPVNVDNVIDRLRRIYYLAYRLLTIDGYIFRNLPIIDRYVRVIGWLSFTDIRDIYIYINRRWLSPNVTEARWRRRYFRLNGDSNELYIKNLVIFLIIINSVPNLSLLKYYDRNKLIC